MSKIYEVNNPSQKFDYLLFILIVTLVLLGLFTVLSASIYVAGSYFFKKQLIYALIGFIAMFAGMRMDFYQLRTLLKPAMYIVTFFMVATYIPFLGGTTVNGANGWV